MSAPDGTPTNAAYGFANTLIKYLADTDATHAAVAFDFSEKSFRNAIEPGLGEIAGARDVESEGWSSGSAMLRVGLRVTSSGWVLGSGWECAPRAR
jgi:hypothetical protein